jgi:hypothetical protein
MEVSNWAKSLLLYTFFFSLLCFDTILNSSLKFTSNFKFVSFDVYVDAHVHGKQVKYICFKRGRLLNNFNIDSMDMKMHIFQLFFHIHGSG